MTDQILISESMLDDFESTWRRRYAEAATIQDVMRRALDEIAGLSHDEECKTQMATSHGHPTADTPCTCHVGIAEKALAAADHVAKETAAEKPVEHVAVVRPDEPGTVHFEPPLTDTSGNVIDRLDFEHRPDGTLRLTVMARRR